LKFFYVCNNLIQFISAPKIDTLVIKQAGG